MSVTQSWVRALPWKQQSILFSGLRGPDTMRCLAVKGMSRWMRAVSQENADPSKPYMDSRRLPDALDVMEELEHLPTHFVHHFADALAVIAYGHPDAGTRECAYEFHALVAEELFHFIPEPPEIFAWRHRDKPNGNDSAPAPPFDDRPWMHDLLPRDYRHA
jgi:hypothetical protein